MPAETILQEAYDELRGSTSVQISVSALGKTRKKILRSLKLDSVLEYALGGGDSTLLSQHVRFNKSNFLILFDLPWRCLLFVRVDILRPSL